MFGFLKKEQVEPPLPAVPTIWSTPSFQEHGPRVVRFTTNTRATILITRALSIATIKLLTAGRALTAQVTQVRTERRKVPRR